MEKTKTYPGSTFQNETQPASTSSNIHHTQSHSDDGSSEPDNLNPDAFDDNDQDENATSPPEVTLKDMQMAINEQHPFGLRIWKPALYKKNRSIDAAAYEALHSFPLISEKGYIYFSPGNVLWALLFGWWFALLYLSVALLVLGPLAVIGMLGKSFFCCGVFGTSSPGGLFGLFYNFFAGLADLWLYSKSLFTLAGYIFWPFGKFIAKRRLSPSSSQANLNTSSTTTTRQTTDDAVRIDIQEDLSSSQQTNQEDRLSEDSDGMSESSLLLAGSGTSEREERTWNYWNQTMNWLYYSRYENKLPGTIFLLAACVFLAPIHLIVIVVCFFLVIPVPMGRMNYILLKHILKHPLRLSVHTTADLQSNNPEAPALLRAHERAKTFLQRKAQAEANTSGSNPPPPPPQQPEQPSTSTPTATPIPKSPGPHNISHNTAFRPYSIAVSDVQDTSFSSSSSAPLHPPKQPLVPSDIFLDPEATVAIATDQDLNARLTANKSSSEYIIILCIRHATGLQYYKYTIDGVNIILFNFLWLVVLTLIDFYLLRMFSSVMIFGLALLSVIPLAYFIGMSVSSITAQTGSLGLGAVINATFGSIVEVILYCLALMGGKERMVEGSIIGSFLCGLLALPGAAMLVGGLKRKEQRFNVKSAGVTGTLMIMALIGAFTPTLFQQIYGGYELRCQSCPVLSQGLSPDNIAVACKSCFYTQPHPTTDPLYESRTRPLMYFCAFILLFTYAVGLWFTLRTHSKRIYPVKNFVALKKEKRLKNTIWQQIIKHHQLERQQERILQYGRSSKKKDGQGSASSTAAKGKSVNFSPSGAALVQRNITARPYISSPNLFEPRGSASNSPPRSRPHTLVGNEKSDPAATTNPYSDIPTYPTQDPSVRNHNPGRGGPGDGLPGESGEVLSTPMFYSGADDFSSVGSLLDSDEDIKLPASAAPNKSSTTASSNHSGHDNPNWGTAKSAFVLMTSTFAFAMIAEILIDCIDPILAKYESIDEKFLGLTLFALVPCITEFYNAIAFANQGNIILALEIGSAYTIQVALLQIPALVAFSAFFFGSPDPSSGQADIYATSADFKHPFRFAYAIYSRTKSLWYKNELINETIVVRNPFTLIFPRFDVYAVLFGTFILTYIYHEGKSNYFKGAMLLLAYSVFIIAFFWVPPGSFSDSV